MTRIERRGFLKLAGTGSAGMAAAVAVPGIAQAEPEGDQTLRFSAAIGLPRPPLNSHATHVVEGTVNMAKGTGRVTTRVLAGHLGTIGMALPGLGREIRITGAGGDGSLVRLQGLIEEGSDLQPGERPRVEIVVDRKRGIVKAPFVGRTIDHEMSRGDASGRSA